MLSMELVWAGQPASGGFKTSLEPFFQQGSLIWLSWTPRTVSAQQGAPEVAEHVLCGGSYVVPVASGLAWWLWACHQLLGTKAVAAAEYLSGQTRLQLASAVHFNSSHKMKVPWYTCSYSLMCHRRVSFIWCIHIAEYLMRQLRVRPPLQSFFINKESHFH